MTTFLTVKLPSELLEKLRDLAKRENRSMSAQALHIITQYLDGVAK
jgi:predicted transcriptional regulator